MQIDSTTRSQLLSLGLGSSDGMSWNASASELYELAIMRGEAQVADGGSLVVTTGSHTGRSPRDKFIFMFFLCSKKYQNFTNARLAGFTQ